VAGQCPANHRDQDDRDGDRDQHHRDREETAGQQQRQAHRQPGDEQHRGQDGYGRERLPAQILTARAKARNAEPLQARALRRKPCQPEMVEASAFRPPWPAPVATRVSLVRVLGNAVRLGDAVVAALPHLLSSGTRSQTHALHSRGDPLGSSGPWLPDSR
jgi:hypothetical protein